MEEHFEKKYYLILFSSMLGPLSTNAIIPIFNLLKENFLLEEVSLISLAISFYIFPFSILQLFAGTFSDIVDKRSVVSLGFIIFLFSLVLVLVSVLIKNYFLFLTSFLLLGLGFSMINPTILAILNLITPTRKKGLMMGLYNSSAAIGVSLGAIISGVFANILGEWRFIFFLNPILTIFAFTFFMLATKNCELGGSKTHEFNIITNNVRHEQNSKFRAAYLQLKDNLTSKIIILGLIGFFTFFCVITLTNTLMEQIGKSIENISDQEIISIVSTILTVNGFISIILSPITGDLLKKISPLKMMLSGFILMLSTIFLPHGKSFLHYILISGMIYVGSAMIWPALFKQAMDLNREASGTNSAIINSASFLGYASVGIIYVLIGIPLIFYVVIGLNLFGIFLIVLLKKKE